MFNIYKNIIDRDTVDVHADYRVYATELIKFISVIITTRVKNDIARKKLNEKYSCKQIFRMLSKYKKARTEENGQWDDVTKLKYIEELTKTLDVWGLKYGFLYSFTMFCIGCKIWYSLLNFTKGEILIRLK